jgi:hypothetical protein
VAGWWRNGRPSRAEYAALLRGADQRLERAPRGDQLAAHFGAGQDAVTEPPRRIVARAEPILDGASDGEDPELHLLGIFPAKEISPRGDGSVIGGICAERARE